MGGKGELVTYDRIFKKAKTRAERKSLKREINEIIDQASTMISIIALVEVEGRAIEVEGEAVVRERVGRRKRATKRRGRKRRRGG